MSEKGREAPAKATPTAPRRRRPLADAAVGVAGSPVVGVAEGVARRAAAAGSGGTAGVAALSPAQMLYLQRTAGNRAVQRLASIRSDPGRVQRRLQYEMGDSLDRLLQTYTDQATEIKQHAYSKYGFGYEKGGTLVFTLLEQASQGISEDVAGVFAAGGSTLDDLKNSDVGAAAIVGFIEALGVSDEKTEALKTMHIFLHVNSKVDGLIGLLGNEPRVVRGLLLKEAQTRFGTALYNLEILPNADVRGVLDAPDPKKQLTMFLQRGLNAVKAQWAKLAQQQDKEAYVKKRIAHESSKGYNRRFTLVSTPLDKFRPFGDILVDWWYSSSKGAPLYPPHGVSWDLARGEFIGATYEKYNEDGRLKVADFRGHVVGSIAALLYNKFATLGLEHTKTNFNGFYDDHKGTIKNYLEGVDVPTGVAREVCDDVVPYLMDLVLLQDK